MKYRVWHIPQVPMTPFYVEVVDLATANSVRGALADYDLFQYVHKVKPDFANASGIEQFEDGEWVEVDEDELERAPCPPRDQS